MIFALLVLVPLVLLAAWMFFRLSPRVGDQRKVVRFNLGVLVLGLAMCGLLTLRVYSGMSAGPDRAWWPVVSALYSLALFPGVLLLGGLVRNLVLFRSRDRQGQ